jgi:glycosyltransferase involved in cell wall biosynthesis
MHVLLIHQAFVSPSEAGGTRHFELGQSLLKAGYRFTIVAGDVSYLTGKSVLGNRAVITEQEYKGIRVLRAYTYPSIHRGFAWRIVSFLSFMVSSVYAGMKAGPIDLVIGTSPPIFQAVSAWIVAVLRKRPFLLEIRDLWPEFAIDMGVLKNPVLIGLSRWLENFLYARADHILVNSPAYRDYVHSKGIALEKISLIANGVDPTLFDPLSGGGDIRQELALGGDCFVVTYAGALGMANDIPTALRAAERLRDHKNIRFLFVGDGKEQPNLKKMAEGKKLSNVTFTGARPKVDMPAILAASDACLAILMDIPMFRTTYPNKVFDYMAAARPTLLAIDGVIREVLEEAGGGIFVPPGDDEALAAAVLKLSTNPGLAREMGAAARAYVIHRFNRIDQAQEFVALVNRLRAEAS